MAAEKHPIREVFVAYLRGELLRGQHALEEHVESCDRCKIMLETLRPIVASEHEHSSAQQANEEEHINNR